MERGERMKQQLRTEEERQKEIKREMARLNQKFSGLEPKTKKAVASLIENAAFMAATLSELREEINLNGTTEEYQNGENQRGIKKSAAVEVYTSLSKNHMTVMKQLTDLLPKDVKPEKDDGFDSFVKNK